MIEGRANHTATLLPDGKVLIAGGAAWTSPFGSFGAFPTLSSAELYTPEVLVPALVLFSVSGEGGNRSIVPKTPLPSGAGRARPRGRLVSRGF
jgi:hypothetical protein